MNIEKLLNMSIIEFFKHFDEQLLKLIYNSYYDTNSEVTFYHNSYFDFLEINIDKIIVGDAERVNIRYDKFSRYDWTVDKLLTAIKENAFNEFLLLREISLGVNDDYISDCILEYKRG